MLTNIRKDLLISKYKCHKCEKAFKRSDILQRHVTRIHLSTASTKSTPILSNVTVAPSTQQAASDNRHNNTLAISNLISNEPPVAEQQLNTFASKDVQEKRSSLGHLVGPDLSSNDGTENIDQNHKVSPLSNSDIYSWISDIAPLDSEAALASSIFDNNDMGWLFSELDNRPHFFKNEHSVGHGVPKNGNILNPTRILFSPLPDFLTTLADSNLQTPTNLLALKEHLQSVSEKDETEEAWLIIERKIKEVLFDEYDDTASASPKLTLSNAYSRKLVDNEFFHPTTMKRLYNLYFEVFHDHFPILHKPTFLQKPQSVAPLLIVSMLTLGAFHDSAENYLTAVELHQRLRWLIFSSQDLIPPKLWTIQTLALIQAFEKMASTRHQHEVSATFHSAVITLLRRDGSCANMRPVKYSSSDTRESSPDDEWSLWIERESIKRSVLFLFMMDAQHSLLFGHTSFMSATEIRLDLPCNDEIWNAETIYEWSQKVTEERNSELGKTESSFVETLKSLLNERLLPLNISPFAKLCVLHGLLSVIWHTQQNDPGSLEVNGPSKSFQSRRDILERAIETWSFSVMSRASSLATDVARVMHKLAFITLYTSQTSLLDILTFCGSASLIGRPLRSSDFIKSKESVEKWVASEDATQGFIHSLLLIHQIVFSGSAFEGPAQKYSAKSDKIALRPWCLYISTLIVWVYSFFKQKSIGGRIRLPQTKDLEIHSSTLKAEEFVLSSLRPQMQGYNQDGKTNGKGFEKRNPSYLNSVYLLIVVRDSLKDCRWEMMRDAHTCLGKLIGLDKDNL